MCLIVLCSLSLCYMCIYLFDCYSMYMLFVNKEFIHSFNKATHKHCFLAKSTESYRVGSHKIERIM